MSYFAQPTLGRDQLALIPTTLNDAIPEDHEVRLLDDILQTQDWSSWEVEYSLRRGQPPIPPRVLASVILYGLLRRIRSSRVLEYLTGHNVDFLWLTEGRTIDHTTLCKFRTRFKQPLRRFWPMASMRPARTSWAWNNRGWSSSHRLRQANRSRRIRPFGPIRNSRCRKRPGGSCRSARRRRSWTSRVLCSCRKRTCTTVLVGTC